jgi:DNA-binding transcriptional MerR regulator
MAHVDNDSLIGVPFRQAATVIGVAEQRLRRWNAIGLVLPSIVGSVGSRHYWSYGLEDIVQGRVVRDLEDRGVHIRAIRRIVEAVRSATTPRPLAELTWGVADGEAFVQYPDGGWVGNRRPVQGVMVEVLNLELLRAAARKEILLRPQHLAGEFEKRRGTLGSKRCSPVRACLLTRSPRISDAIVPKPRFSKPSPI